MKKLHAILHNAAYAIAGLSLCWFLLSLFWLKSPIGIHFDGNGNFDVIDSKFYGFYPHGINLLVLGITALFSFLAGKVRTGIKVTEEGEAKLTDAFRFSLDWGRLLLVIFFSYWNALVITQHPLKPIVPGTILILMMMGLVVLIGVFIIIRIRYRRKGNPNA